MNHLYFEEEKVTRFAQALVSSEPFTDGTFLLFRDVPLKSLSSDVLCFRSSRNLGTMDAHTSLQSVDYMVCRDKHPVLAITFDFDPRDSKQIFGTVLRGLAHIAVNSCDFQQSDYDTDGLLRCILEQLNQLPAWEYTLHLHTVLAPCCKPDLQGMKLLNSCGNATKYGRDCGLLFHCQTDSNGSLIEVPVVAGMGFSMYHDVIHYTPEEKANLLPELLNSDTEDLFKYHKEQLQELQQIVFQAKDQQLCSADAQLRTFADILMLLRELSGKEDAMHACQQIRQCIIPALCFVGRHCDYPILGQTLQQFCTEVACYSGSYYPLWLCRRQLLPYLNSIWGGELSFSAVLNCVVSTKISNLEHTLFEVLLCCCEAA